MKKLLFFAAIAIALQLTTFDTASATATLTLVAYEDSTLADPTPAPAPPEKSEDQYLNFNFGLVKVNTTSSVVYSVKNTGTTALKIEKIIYSGPQFYASTACPDVLEVGKSCNTRITFWPTFEGLSAGDVIWYTSDNNIILNLLGTGSQF